MNGVKKAYYSISEVCSQVGLEPHVLRYWESEFTQLHPKKNRAGNRAYRDKDIETINFIKKLLYEEEYTISGAKKKLAVMKETHGEKQAPSHAGMNADILSTVRTELKGILTGLQ